MALAALSVTVELNLMEAEVGVMAKKLQETIDRLRSDFQQHRQVRRPAVQLSSCCGCSRQASWLNCSCTWGNASSPRDSTFCAL